MHLDERTYSTRRYINDQITDAIDESDPVVAFDERVEFMSRAAADEVVATAIEHGADIDASDADETVRKMLAAVLATDSERASEIDIDIGDTSVPPTGS